MTKTIKDADDYLKRLSCKHISAILDVAEKCGIYEWYDVVYNLSKNYFTVNTARSGRDVVWYMDATNEVCMYVDSHEVLNDKEIEDELL